MSSPSIALETQRSDLPGLGLALHGIGLFLSLVCGSIAAWGHGRFWTYPDSESMVALCVLAYLLSAWITPRLVRFPGARSELVVVGVLTLAFLGIVGVVAALRLYYSRTFLPTAFLCALIAQIGIGRILRGRPGLFAVVPGGMAKSLEGLGRSDWLMLDRPETHPNTRAVIADLHAPLGEDWLRFLAGCSIRGVPVYHAAVAYESVTGRISVIHHSRADLEGFSMRPVYGELKVILELALVAITTPLWLPITLLVALAIKLESRGPVLFWQTRTGKGGKPFRMVKFRSMYLDAEDQGPSFAQENDARVTPIGRFIRRYRIDELPQIWNVLKGEMSLIGPRPEQLEFAATFEREVPMYAFRHLVRPGITGWAQVNQGYAEDTDETRIKLEHDLYYVKHLSFWLDMMIALRTLRTIATGFGSR